LRVAWRLWRRRGISFLDEWLALKAEGSPPIFIAVQSFAGALNSALAYQDQEPLIRLRHLLPQAGEGTSKARRMRAGYGFVLAAQDAQ
jgi:hypothetical protein